MAFCSGHRCASNNVSKTVAPPPTASANWVGVSAAPVTESRWTAASSWVAGGRSTGSSNVEMHPGTRVAAFVDGVVQQPCMAPDGHPLASGGEVRFGGYGILVVAELVSRVRQRFDERDGDVGRRSTRSSRG